MADTQEQFDLTQSIDEPANNFKVVHLYNKSDKYHLTRQVLLDSSITQATYCFFYHILDRTIHEFNETYASFACLIERNTVEADLYLNVDSEALSHIIKYIQTGKMDEKQIYNNNHKTVDEMTDLAIMFGMPTLVSKLRILSPSDEHINEVFNVIKSSVNILLMVYKLLFIDDESFDIDCLTKIFEDFINTNKQEIIDTYIKPNMYKKTPLWTQIIMMFFTLFITPLITKYSNKFTEKNNLSTPAKYACRVAEPMEQRTSYNNYNIMDMDPQMFMNSMPKARTSENNIGSVDITFSEPAIVKIAREILISRTPVSDPLQELLNSLNEDVVSKKINENCIRELINRSVSNKPVFRELLNGGATDNTNCFVFCSNPFNKAFGGSSDLENDSDDSEDSLSESSDDSLSDTDSELDSDNEDMLSEENLKETIKKMVNSECIETMKNALNEAFQKLLDAQKN